MNDLLNEDEFLPKKYNPWNRFYIFSVFALLEQISFIVILKHFVQFSERNTAIMVGITNNFIFPLLIASFMVLGKKELLLHTSKKTIIKGLILLECCYLTPLIINSLSNFYTWALTDGIEHVYPLLVIPLFTIAFNLALVLVLILPLIKRARKINHNLPK